MIGPDFNQSQSQNAAGMFAMTDLNGSNAGRLSYVSFGANGQPQYHFIGAPTPQQTAAYQQSLLANSGN